MLFSLGGAAVDVVLSFRGPSFGGFFLGVVLGAEAFDLSSVVDGVLVGLSEERGSLVCECFSTLSSDDGGLGGLVSWVFLRSMLGLLIASGLGALFVEELGFSLL